MPAPLSPEQLGEASRRLDKLTQSLEDSILEDICRRIAKAGAVTDTAEYQLMRLKEMGYANSFIEKSIADYMDKSEDEIRQLFFEAAQVSSDFYEKYYLQNGKAAIPLEDNEYMQQLISAGIEQTKGELKNFTQSMGFAVKQPDGSLKFQPIAKAYQSCLDLAHSQVATGVFDYNTAIRNATAGLTARGLQFVDYASGHRNRADVAVRRAVLTGIGQMAAKAAEKAMDDLDAEYVEVTAHAGARPDHSKWQGRIYHWDRKNKAASDTTKPLDNGGGSGIIGVESDRKVIISAIEQPIEQKHTGKGNPNAILIFDVELNSRQEKLLKLLPEYDSRAIVPKDSVNMADLSALTAKTGDEFAMFTKGNERMVVRGNTGGVNIDVEQAKRLNTEGYRWSGHTHPGTGINTTIPSSGDKEILNCFDQEQGVIYDSKGSFRTFEKE